MKPFDVAPNGLCLGDTIKLFDGAFGYAIVNKIADGSVHVYRPYATTADFSYTGGVIPYIGIEQFTLSQQYDTRKVTVVQRKELK